MVVLDKEDSRQFHGSGKVHTFIEIALGSAAVARVCNSDALFAAQLEGKRHTGGLDNLSANDDLRDHAMDIVRDFAAELMAARVQEQLMQRIAMEVALRDIAITWKQEIVFVGRELAANHRCFLARNGGIEAEPALAGKLDGALVPNSREDHALHEISQLLVIE